MFKKGIWMMLIILISRVLGMVRGSVMAYYFGAGQFTDAYYSAFKFANFFRQLLGEGALGNSFIPLYNDKIVAHGEEEGKKFIFSVLNLVFIFSLIISIITFVFSHQIIRYTARGFDIETQNLASQMLRLMAAYFVFISLAGMLVAILNNFRKFLVTATTGIVFNIVLIVTTVLAAKEYAVIVLSYGVVLSGLAQMLILLPQFFKIVKTYSFKIDFKDPYLVKIALMLLPMLVGIFANQINVIVGQYFASFFQVGVVTAIENATRLYNLPIGVFGITISTIVFPSLAKSISNNKMDEFKTTFTTGMNMLLFLVVPCSAVFVFYSREVVEVIFGHGKFGDEAVTVTSSILCYYSIGLFFYTAIHLVTRGFYGMKNTKVPATLSIICVGLNIIFIFSLSKLMGYKSIALASSLSSGINFVTLMIIFNKKYCNLEVKKNFIFFGKVILFVAISFIISYNFNNIYLKFISFAIIYALCWLYPFYKKRMSMFE